MPIYEWECEYCGKSAETQGSSAHSNREPVVEDECLHDSFNHKWRRVWSRVAVRKSKKWTENPGSKGNP